MVQLEFDMHSPTVGISQPKEITAMDLLIAEMQPIIPAVCNYNVLLVSCPLPKGGEEKALRGYGRASWHGYAGMRGSGVRNESCLNVAT